MKSVPAPNQPFDDRHRQFIRHFVNTNGDWNEAANRANLPPGAGYAMMANQHVLRAIEAARRNPDEPTATAAYVKATWLRLATADATELSEHWYVCCRNCWGDRHHYQWTDEQEFIGKLREHTHKMRAYRASDRWELDDLGGYGYTINRDPMRGPDYVDFTLKRSTAGAANSDHSCPRCFGHGVDHVRFADTRHLSAAGRLLYNGVRVTPNGLEMLVRDRNHAMDMLAKHLGMLNPRVPIKVFDPDEMDTDELRTVVETLEERLGYESDGAALDVPRLLPPGPDGPGDGPE